MSRNLIFILNIAFCSYALSQPPRFVPLGDASVPQDCLSQEGTWNLIEGSGNCLTADSKSLPNTTSIYLALSRQRAMAFYCPKRPGHISPCGEVSRTRGGDIISVSTEEHGHEAPSFFIIQEPIHFEDNVPRCIYGEAENAGIRIDPYRWVYGKSALYYRRGSSTTIRLEGGLLEIILTSGHNIQRCLFKRGR